MLDLPEDAVRVIAEDVGGGFGSKSRPYTEEVTVSHASRVLGRPVKWIEDRFEHFQATTHSRSTETALEIGYDGEGRILAMKGRLLVDVGAYIFTSGIITAEVASGHCAGPYRIADISLDVICVGTNKTPLATYRGAGQPEATFPLETMLDMVARELGLSATEIRARNLVTPADMPYTPHIPYAGPKCRFESGDFPALLERAVAGSGYGEVVETIENRERAAWGLACGIESTGFIGFESAEVRIDGAGNVTVFSGMTSQGQGQATTYAKVCAETLGVDESRVTVRMGDTQLLPFGRGAFASRGAVVGANAVAGAASQLREKVLVHAGILLQEKTGSPYRGSGRHSSLERGTDGARPGRYRPGDGPRRPPVRGTIGAFGAVHFRYRTDVDLRPVGPRCPACRRYAHRNLSHTRLLRCPRYRPPSGPGYRRRTGCRRRGRRHRRRDVCRTAL